MLKILIPTTMLMPTVWLTPPKWMWPAMLCHSFLIALISTAWLKNFSETGWSCLSPYLGTDPVSAPLLVLTCWLLPLMILASQNHLTCEPAARQRTYLALLALLQLFLILAFSTTEVLLFYIMFEATLVPTLALITRWGNQTQRLNAGTYLLLFTLAGSLPLLVALLTLRNNTETLSMLLLSHSNMLSLNLFTDKLWWASCLLAFLVKMPMYGVHLWLPKAHVEAPVAGSMVLAAILLKLGGYGMIRVLVCLEPLTQELSYPFIILALWGLIMAGSVCTLQTDLKSLIAYSSVSHMGLVIGALLIQTPWGLSGAMTLMIAHGLTSSALFCLANTNYERTHSRTMTLARGMQLILPLGTTWWLTTSLANLALPPLPNLVGELMILTSLFNWSQWTIMLTGASMFITAAYSLYMFITTQRGPAPPHMLGLEPTHTREHLMMVLHLLPLVLLISKPELVWA